MSCGTCQSGRGLPTQVFATSCQHLPCSQSLPTSPRGHAGPALECSHCQGHQRCHSRHRGSSCSVPPWVQLGVPTAFIQRKAQPGQSVCWDHRLSLLSFLGHGGGVDRPCLSGGPTLSPCLSPTCPRPFSSLLPAAVFFPALSPQPMRAHLTQYLK